MSVIVWNICNFNFLWGVVNIISISLWDFGFFFFLNLLIFNLRFNNWCIACSELSIIYCVLESEHVLSLIPSWEEAVNTRVRVYLARTRRNSPPHHQSLLEQLKLLPFDHSQLVYQIQLIKFFSLLLKDFLTN